MLALAHLTSIFSPLLGEILSNKALLSLVSEVFRTQFFGELPETSSKERSHSFFSHVLFFGLKHKTVLFLFFVSFIIQKRCVQKPFFDNETVSYL
jgi:hypothetical protein